MFLQSIIKNEGKKSAYKDKKYKSNAVHVEQFFSVFSMQLGKSQNFVKF